jgi:hypothetical protein
VVIPEERLCDDFFRLKTGIPGEIFQKFVRYDLQVAIVGNIARHTDQSPAFRDFVYESNEGGRTGFCLTSNRSPRASLRDE